MPADRIQLNEERIDALAELLAEAGLLDRDAADSIKETTDIGDAQRAVEARKNAKNGGSK